MALKFYTNPMSRGRIVRWMLEEVGEPYETEILDFSTTAKSDEFLAINPMGKVPTIVHDGAVVTECAAICAYLAEVFPDKNSARPTPSGRIICAGYSSPPGRSNRQLQIARLAAIHRRTRPAWLATAAMTWRSTRSKRRCRRTTISQATALPPPMFMSARKCCGEPQFGTLPKRDAFAAYAERLSSREAYKRAGDIDNALMPKQD